MSIDLRGMTPLLQVFDMATSLKFYCDILGFEIVQTDSNNNCSESQLGMAEAERYRPDVEYRI